MKLIPVLYLSSMLLFFAACDSTKKAVEDKTNTALSAPVGAYTLQLVSEKNYSDKALILTFDATQNSVHGTTECNGIGAEYSTDGNTITFGAVVSTRMYCEGKMDAEKEISQALSNAATFTLKDNQLQLLDQSGNVILTAQKN